MRLVVLDRSLILPAFRAPEGQIRRLLVVLAYGGVRTYARFGTGEIELAEREGGRLGGRPIEDLVAAAARTAAHLAEHLPDETPDDLVLVVSSPLLSQYQGVLRDHGPKVNLHLTPEELLKRRQELASLAFTATESFDPPSLPRYSHNRESDVAIHTTLLGKADYLVTNVSSVAQDQHEATEYRSEEIGHVMEAVRFDSFIASEVNTLHFDLDEVNGRLLSEALRSISSPV
jgi:hypothetical protein